MDDATTNVDEANQNKEKDVIEANEEEANPFASKKKKQTSRVWVEFKEVTLPDGTVKVEYIHCKHQLGVNKTGVVICDVLQKCLAEWEIEDKVWTISVDNATYNDAAIRMLKDNLAYKNSLALNGKLFHVRCCAHILNLLVQDGLSEIEDIVFNVHESVTHLAKAKSRHLIFSEIAFKEAYFGLWHKVECNIFHAIYCIGV
ncbi:hypothetical protein GH714_035289 [Hevea brasiliensis]|uniref:hAT-like transposase RNase-H fold domain-containing protein n=1 Tax=Hevea brasiliensis TaxID=3981 RepID=A0A6A6L7A7_HEVBR|nr:hypothetical protein GH714_035289 [Hevea brasiliensis]